MTINQWVRPPVSQTVATPNGSIDYYDTGTADHDTVVMCHGLGAGKLQFAADAIHFANLGYRVIVPDLRGHGGSNFTKTPTAEHFQLFDLADDISFLLDQLAIDNAHFVGNSLGGLVGLTLVQHSPDRIASLTTFGTTYSLQTRKSVMKIISWVVRNLPVTWAATLGAKGISKNRLTQNVFATLLKQSDPMVTLAIMKNIANYDLIDVATRASCPILLMQCEHDKQINKELGPTLERLNQLANCTIISLQSAGHCANLDVPDQFWNELNQFWAYSK